MLIHQMLQNTVQKFPDKPAVWFDGKWMTYGEIDRKSTNLAFFFIESGVKRGDRIALLYENSFEYIITYYAILKADAVVVALKTDSMRNSLHFILNHCNTIGAVVSHKFLNRVLQIINEVPTIRFLVSDEAIVGEYGAHFKCEMVLLNAIYDECAFSKSLPQKSINIDLSSIIYTSGSTGEPKGVMLSHLNIVQNTNSIVEYLQLSSHDRIMVVLPFYYVYGSSLLNTHVLTGGSIVIDNRFIYPNLVLETMKNQRVTGFAGVPSTFLILLNNSSLKDYSPFENLRYVTQAGGHMNVPVQELVAETFTPAKLIVMYGATELAPRLTWLSPERWSEKKGSIGVAVPNTEAFVVDEYGNRLQPGFEGEIVGRGSNVMMGYWGDPESTAQVLKDGLYYTGDIGRVDEDGFLYVVGRSKDMLKIGGNRVSAKEIEDAILEVENIEEVAVIAVEDPVLGEAAKAFLVTKANAQVDEFTIKQSLNLKMPVYKIPKYFEFCKSLPKNEFGKILKQKLIGGGG